MRWLYGGSSGGLYGCLSGHCSGAESELEFGCFLWCYLAVLPFEKTSVRGSWSGWLIGGVRGLPFIHCPF